MDRRIKTMSGLFGLLGTVLFCVWPQTSVATELAASDNSIVNTGKYVYLRRCAVCHGESAKGDGVYGPLLTVEPTDLTSLLARNDGKFPFDRVLETISGSELLPAHGARDMPIWGQEFAMEAELLGVDAKTLARARVLEIMAYLADIQEQ